ncbi:MAG: hypothetical protein AB7O60_11435 [Variibacter sp.]
MNSKRNDKPSERRSPDEVEAYSFRASLMSSGHHFKLTPEGLEFQIGRRSGCIPYSAIRRLRISFRPVALASNRYLVELWSDQWPKVQIASTTWRSLAEQVAQTADFAAFIRALHHKIVQARGRPVCEKGSPPWLFWPGVALFVAVALGLAALSVRGLREGTVSGAAFVATFLGIYLWQMGRFFRKNRPGTYNVSAPPDDFLPRA